MRRFRYANQINVCGKRHGKGLKGCNYLKPSLNMANFCIPFKFVVYLPFIKKKIKSQRIH